MFGRTIAAAVALAAMGGTVRAAEPPAKPAISVVTQSDWEVRPTAEQMEQFYPSLAVAFAMDGKVRITCNVRIDHTLGECRVVEEAPTGVGFGVAALAASKLFRMKPETRDGVPVDGATVTIPFPFKINPDDDQSGPPIMALPDLIKPVDPAAKALARRLLAAQGGSEQSSTAIKAMFESAISNATGQPGVDDAAVADLNRALAAATEKVVAMASDQRADYLARAMSLEELQAATAFFESNAGKALMGAQYRRGATMDYREALDRVRAQAVEAFCAGRGCPVSSKK